MIKAILFDLDGTLLPMDEKKFTELYFSLLAKKMYPLGYDPKHLIDAIMSGLKRMYGNNGTKTNEEVFWQSFNDCYGEDKTKDGDTFLSFYQNEFSSTQCATHYNPYAKEIISYCKKKFRNVILSTNPIFPKEAQMMRLSFLDLKIDDFDFVSDYSNSSFCKPNPNYFRNILERFSLLPDEVVLFGNDYVEDGDCASSLGIRTYLIDGCLLHKEKSLKDYPVIKMDEVIPTLERMAA